MVSVSERSDTGLAASSETAIFASVSASPTGAITSGCTSFSTISRSCSFGTIAAGAAACAFLTSRSLRDGVHFDSRIRSSHRGPAGTCRRRGCCGELIRSG